MADISSKVKAAKVKSDINKYLKQLASKFRADGLTASTITKKKALRICGRTVAPVFNKKLVNSFYPEIKKLMKRK